MVDGSFGDEIGIFGARAVTEHLGRAGDHEPCGLVLAADAPHALEVLSSLPGLAGGVRLAYLDPPFDCLEAFPHLEAPVARRSWSDMLHRCVSALNALLRPDGTLWLHVDRTGEPCCRSILDGSGSFSPVRTILWDADADGCREGEEHVILVYARRGGTRSVVAERWSVVEAGSRAEGRAEVAGLLGSEPFAYAKPERLLRRIIASGTRAGDVFVDCFLGSGTGGAVAHKMVRPWIGVERDARVLERFAIPRLRRVIGGRDPGGVSSSEGWTRGGHLWIAHMDRE